MDKHLWMICKTRRAHRHSTVKKLVNHFALPGQYMRVPVAFHRFNMALSVFQILAIHIVMKDYRIILYINLNCLNGDISHFQYGCCPLTYLY